MTLHCLLVEPPAPGRSLPALAEGPLDPDAAAALHEAAIRDAMLAAERSGGELLVNYPPAEARPDGEPTPEAALRSLAASTLSDPDVVRYEVQVGGDLAAQAGNAATHLLETEDVDTVAILRGTAPTLDRTALDGAAMQLRRHAVAIAPGTGGRVAYLGLGASIDFEDAFAPPEVETLADRGVAAGHEVAFLPRHPVIEDEFGLVSLVAELRARRRAERVVPTHTAATVADLGLRVAVEQDGRRLVTDE